MASGTVHRDLKLQAVDPEADLCHRGSISLCQGVEDKVFAPLAALEGRHIVRDENPVRHYELRSALVRLPLVEGVLALARIIVTGKSSVVFSDMSDAVCHLMSSNEAVLCFSSSAVQDDSAGPAFQWGCHAPKPWGPERGVFHKVAQRLGETDRMCENIMACNIVFPPEAVNVIV